MDMIPYANDIIDTASLVQTLIYCIEHTASGKKYVGQTVTHRMNHGRYRPFGLKGRFGCHVSEAVRNTKHKSGHLLGVAIREFGKDAFTATVVETCTPSLADEREIAWIAKLDTMYPNGYNLTSGGKQFSTGPVIPNPDVMSVSRARGGSTQHSAETRAKMSKSNAIASSTPAARALRAKHALEQHAAKKAERFRDQVVDHENLEQYIRIAGDMVVVRVGCRETSFSEKGVTSESNLRRAREFLLSLPMDVKRS